MFIFCLEGIFDCYILTGIKGIEFAKIKYEISRNYDIRKKNSHKLGEKQKFEVQGVLSFYLICNL